MKKVIVSASAVALLAGVLLLTRDALSQQAADRSAASADQLPHKVGLIDMAFVFKHYTKFETLREDLKAEIAASEEHAKQTQQETAALQQKLKDLKEGSPEHQRVEKQLVSAAAEFESFRREKSRDFLKKESKIYSQIYHEVEDVVRQYAEHFKYTLVIRFNREDPDTDNPQQVLQNMNRQVVYYRENDDITNAILNKLNKNLAKEKAPAARDAAPARDSSQPSRPPRTSSAKDKNQ